MQRKKMTLRFDLDRPEDKQAWEYLQNLKAPSINKAVLTIINQAERASRIQSALRIIIREELAAALKLAPVQSVQTEPEGDGMDDAKGGTPAKGKDALTDTQVKQLLETVRGLPPQTFVMIGLFAGLRREEILALQWDCVFLDVPTPYISVRRAWRSEHNRPIISRELKTDAAKRDIPIPECLVNRLREVKAASISDFVIADSEGNPLSYSQFRRLWQYINVRTAMNRTYYKYVNGQSIKYTVEASLGAKSKNNHDIAYTIDTPITPHQLRHTYITNLIYASVDPKTVQYLAGHENSKVTMDIYAKVKYNRPSELSPVVNEAFGQRPA